MRRLFPLFALFLALTARAQINPEWTTPLPPFQIADNLYYVGSQDLAAYLVTTRARTSSINANLEASPPQIRASVGDASAVCRFSIVLRSGTESCANDKGNRALGDLPISADKEGIATPRL